MWGAWWANGRAGGPCHPLLTPARPLHRALGDIGNVVGAFNQKVTVGKEGDAKAGKEVRGAPARPEIVSGVIGGAAGPARAAPAPAGGGSWGQASKPAAPPAPPPFPCLPLQGNRTGVLTRRAAAQLAAAGTGNGQVRAEAGQRLKTASRRPPPQPPTPPRLPSLNPPRASPPRPQAANAGSWGATKPRNGLRPRDSNVPVVSQAVAGGAAEAKPTAAPGRSMSQLLHARSEAALSGGKSKKQCMPVLPDIDSADAADPLNACDFVSDIFGYYKRVEPQLRVAPDYMTRQVGGQAGSREGSRMGRRRRSRAAVAPGTTPAAPARRPRRPPAPPRPRSRTSTTRCARS